MSQVKDQTQWYEHVARVFNVAPRIGKKGTYWYERRGKQDALGDAFHRPSNHVCIDGPTGTGKSSLALTFLERSRIPYSYVSLTKNMDWPSFCRELARPVIGPNEERSVNVGLEAGLSAGLLPHARFKCSLGRRSRPSDSSARLVVESESWAEHDIARLMAKENVALVVDDVERASGTMVERLADLCKTLINLRIGGPAKVMFVGTSDTYRRIYREVRSLEHRIAGVNLGPLSNVGDSWHFLRKGLETLKLRHPGNSIFPMERSRRGACEKAIHDAADGLPKSLNQLGQDIVKRARHRKGVSAYDIITQSVNMAHHNWANHRRDFSGVLTVLRRDPAAVEVLRVLYARGVCAIHDSHTVHGLVCSALSEAEVELVVDQLVEADFMVRTGPAGDVLYVTDPIAAHALGVVMSSPETFKGARSLVQSVKGYDLAFPPSKLAEIPPDEDVDQEE